MFKGFIFDWDNTLVDSLGAIKGAVSDTLDTFDYAGDRGDIIASAGVSLSLREGFPTIFGNKWQDAGQHFYKAYSACIPLIEKKTGYDDMVAYLQNNNLPCTINSNKAHKLLEQELKHFNAHLVFLKRIGAGVMPHDKPASDGALALIDFFKNKFSILDGFCYVGDSATDIKCGRNAGISTVLIGNDKLALAENPDYAFESLTDFVKDLSK